jgi:glycosyltransferase involved in cell wall biosynthesis
LKVAYLGPFINSKLRPFLNTLSEEDCNKSPGMGGYGLIELIEERLYRKQETIVITLDTNLQDESIIRKGDLCSLYSLPKRKTKSLRDLFGKEKKLILDAIEDSKPDIIHAHWTSEYAFAVLKLKIPTIITAHDNPKDILKYLGRNYLPLYLLSNYVIKKAKYITAVSPNVLDYIKRKRSNGYELIPNPLPQKLFDYSANQIKNYDYEIPNITSVLNWNELKNPKNAILGFNLILPKYPDAQLHLFGLGMGKNEQCEEWCIENGKEQNIIFYGKVNNEYLREQLKTTTILLHTSRTEACSMVIAEALLFGVPCIGGIYSGGVPWQLDSGTAGLLIDINDPNEISKAINKLLSNKNTRYEIGNAAKKNAIKIFNPQSINQKWDFLYKNIINDFYKYK